MGVGVPGRGSVTEVFMNPFENNLSQQDRKTFQSQLYLRLRLSVRRTEERLGKVYRY